ncbi:eIF2A-related protein [Adonisia turfae]|uniref:NACHT domain-containing protein n=1 Tax=Adonisia turfae CCMR0081 TaxID=2292702 RepID=A0A6M0RGQ6_9CYAN|nr:caspase family protein [Adonisia turfae]NEZ55385.1 NACHT domain-containing protein [Adonisia turfae CCMR0081]
MPIAAFSRSLAVIIGINHYANGISQLKTATHDARVLAQQLKYEHGYAVDLLVDKAATKEAILHLLKELSKTITENDRLLFYFAGHGLAMDGDDGPAGYLIPQDARLGQHESFLPMHDLHQSLTALSCRHSLIILDCCFSGAFRWSSTRDVSTHPEIIYKERFDRFVQDPAWQVITSAAYDQLAHDVSQSNLEDHRGQGHSSHHSPFAEALFEALGGAADCFPIASNSEPHGDGVITATELYLYLRDRVELQFDIEHQQQTPGLWPLRKHDKGEYIFLVPGHELNLPPAPELNTANNPYRGLAAFDEDQAHLFFGRNQLITDLQVFVCEHPLTVVLGPSGTGKSSLVKAGLIPALRESDDIDWQILSPVRPGDSPLRSLARAILALNPDQITDTENIDALAVELAQEPKALTRQVLDWGKRHPHKYLLLVIDQFEELVTQCRNEHERQQFLELIKKAIRLAKDRGRIVLTLRSDFEPQFVQSPLKEIWMQSRFLVKPMTQDELRQAIEAPAAERVMVFEPYGLVEQLINEVVQMPGALPLLSFTLSELYLRYLQREDGNRAMTQADYEALGGVAGSLTQRATQEYEALMQQDPAYEHTMKRVMLRMVAIEGGELARRRVSRSELVYSSEAENDRIGEVIRRLTAARLVVEGQDPGGEPYVEPAHDALVQGWSQLLRWKNEAQNNLFLQRQVAPAAKAWSERKGTLWNADPRLALFKPMLRLEQTWLNGIETEFIRRSLQTKRTNQLIRLGSVITFIAVVSSLGLFANAERLKADKNALDAEFKATESDINAWEATINQTDALIQTWIAKHNAETAKANEKRANEQTKIAQDNAIIAETRRRETEEARKAEAEQRRVADVQKDLAIQRQKDAEYQATVAQLREQAARVLNWLPTLDAPKAMLLALQTFDQSEAVGEPVLSLAQSSLLSAVQRMRERNVLFGHTDRVHSVTFSPDGKYIVSGSEDKTLRLWDLQGNLIGQPFQTESSAYAIAFSPDGKYIASGGGTYGIQLWDLKGNPIGKPLQGHTGRVESIAFSPDSQYIASGSRDKTVRLWDLQGNPVVKPLQGHESDVYSVVFSPDSQYIASGSRDKTIRLWDVASGERLRTLRGHTSAIWSVAFSPYGRIIASGSGNGGNKGDTTIRLWNLQGDPIGNPFQGHIFNVSSIAFSPNGQFIASGSTDGTIRLWDLTGNLIGNPLQGHTSGVYSVAFSPDGQQIVSGSGDGTNNGDNTVRLWDLPTHATALLPQAPMAFSPDGQILATRNAHLWDLQGNLIGELFQDRESPIISVAFSPDGQYIVGGSFDKTVRLWDLKGNAMSEPFRGHTSKIRSLAFSPDGQYIVGGSFDKTVHLWDLQGNAVREPFQGHTDTVESVAFSPNGKYIVSGSGIRDKTLRLWDLQDNSISIPFQGHTSVVFSVAFSPNGKYIISGSADSTLRLWDLQGNPIGNPFRGHVGQVLKVAFSPNGQHIVSSGVDKTVRLWDLQGRAVGNVFHGSDIIRTIAFSSDGQYILGGSIDKTINLLPGSLQSWLAVACDRMRYHPMLHTPKTVFEQEPDMLEIALVARKTCKKRVWDNNNQAS